jgi:hypothetical protein
MNFMKKLPIMLFALSLSLGAVHAQTSYTNADLGISPMGRANTNQGAIPGAPEAQATAQSSKYPPLAPEQQVQFVQQMNALIQAQENKVQGTLNRVNDQSLMPNDWDRVNGEQAIINLSVKKTIVEKFQNSPSLRSPLVRQALIQILSNEDIQPADISQLQSIVDSERPLTYP